MLFNVRLLILVFLSKIVRYPYMLWMLGDTLWHNPIPRADFLVLWYCIASIRYYLVLCQIVLNVSLFSVSDQTLKFIPTSNSTQGLSVFTNLFIDKKRNRTLLITDFYSSLKVTKIAHCGANYVTLLITIMKPLAAHLFNWFSNKK